MVNQGADRKFVRDSTSPVSKPEKCPKCGGKKVTSCPGGASLKAVPGIWWICDDCKHQW
jgi:transcription elongation factor Elf1